MARYEYILAATANSDRVYHLTYREAVKMAKVEAKKNGEDCFIDVIDEWAENGTGDMANFWYTVSPEGVVKKH
jgi:hypothetical protein